MLEVEQTADRAIDGIVGGYPVDVQREWSSAGELTGAWIRLTWATPQKIGRSILHDRINLSDHILAGSMTFSDGSTLMVGALPNDGSGLTQDFAAPKTVTWVQFSVVSAAGESAGLAEWEIFTAVSPGGHVPDVVIDFGPVHGLWLSKNPRGATPDWSQLNVQSPTLMATADLDGNDQADLIANFQGYGVWVWSNNTSWSRLHPFDVTDLVVGDLDGNGRPDLVMSFPGYGVWAYMNNTTWVQLHTREAAGMDIGNLDNDSGHRDEVIVNFPGSGVWIWTNNTTWVQLNAKNASHIRAADMDGNGKIDVALDFPGDGLWTWMNNDTWIQRHTLNTTGMTSGNLDGDVGGQADLVVGFEGYGEWALMNNTTWTQLYPTTFGAMTTADLDFNGRADLVVTIPGAGVYTFMNNTNWVQLHPVRCSGLRRRADRQQLIVASGRAAGCRAARSLGRSDVTPPIVHPPFDQAPCCSIRDIAWGLNPRIVAGGGRLDVVHAQVTGARLAAPAGVVRVGWIRRGRRFVVDPARRRGAGDAVPDLETELETGAPCGTRRPDGAGRAWRRTRSGPRRIMNGPACIRQVTPRPHRHRRGGPA